MGTTSSTASELFGAVNACSECMALCEWVDSVILVEDARIDERFGKVPMLLIGDNLAALRICKKGFGSCSRLYCDNKRATSLRIGLLYDLLCSGMLKPVHISTKKNIADLGTKIHNRHTFLGLSKEIGMCWSFFEFEDVLDRGGIQCNFDSTANKKLLSCA